MKLFLFIPLLFCVLCGQAQGKDYNKTRQIDQLQQLRQTVKRKIDSLQAQLLESASGIAITRKKLDQLLAETKDQPKPDNQSKEQLSKLALELQVTTRQAEELQKKFDSRLQELDRTLNLQKDLDDKIIALTSENDK